MRIRILQESKGVEKCRLSANSAHQNLSIFKILFKQERQNSWLQLLSVPGTEKE